MTSRQTLSKKAKALQERLGLSYDHLLGFRFAMNVFIASMPKVELHLHIEGSLEPEMLFDLGKRNAVALPFASAAEVRQAYNFGNLKDFLDIYY